MGFFNSLFGTSGKVLKKVYEGACNFVKGFGGNGVYAVKNLFGAVCDGTAGALGIGTTPTVATNDRYFVNASYKKIGSRSRYNGDDDDGENEYKDIYDDFQSMQNSNPIAFNNYVDVIDKISCIFGKEIKNNNQSSINYETLSVNHKFDLKEGDEVIVYNTVQPFEERIEKRTDIIATSPITISTSYSSSSDNPGAGLIIDQMSLSSTIENVQDIESYTVVEQRGFTSNNNNTVYVNESLMTTQVETDELENVIQQYRRELKFTDEDVTDFFQKSKLLYGYNTGEKFEGGNVIVNAYRNANVNEMQTKIFWKKTASGKFDNEGNIVGGKNMLLNTLCTRVKMQGSKLSTYINKDMGYITSKGSLSSESLTVKSPNYSYKRAVIMLTDESIKSLMITYKQDAAKFDRKLLKTALKTAIFRKRYPIYRNDKFVRFGGEDEVLKDDEEMEVSKVKLIFI